MKNIKDSLFEWRNHFTMTLLCALLSTLPIIAVVLPIGSDYETYKWLIFGFIVVSSIGHNILISRCENYEQTIEKMNDEIEYLKDELNVLKRQNESA